VSDELLEGTLVGAVLDRRCKSDWKSDSTGGFESEARSTLIDVRTRLIDFAT